MSFYDALGVAPDDPDLKIRARYRLLARATHPDMNQGAVSPEFVRYAEAYKVLSNPEQRRAYNLERGFVAQSRPIKPGHDLYQRITISRTDALAGGVFPLSFRRYEPCSRCWLQGCPRCVGQGLIPIQIEVSVRVPAGTKRPATVFVDGCGGVSEPGGQRGHLLVYVSIAD